MTSQPSWLTSIAGAEPAPRALHNRRTGACLASVVEPAFASSSRRRGLLGRDSLPPGHAIVLAPCNAVHTFFMRFAIDVLFVARTGEILRIDRSVPPWRTAIAWRAHAVVELAAGSVSTVDARAGDELELVAMSADEASPRL